MMGVSGRVPDISDMLISMARTEAEAWRRVLICRTCIESSSISTLKQRKITESQKTDVPNLWTTVSETAN